MNEANVTINGVQLSAAESMTVRVALGSFAISLGEGLGTDDASKGIVAGYQQCITHIQSLMGE